MEHGSSSIVPAHRSASGGSGSDSVAPRASRTFGSFADRSNDRLRLVGNRCRRRLDHNRQTRGRHYPVAQGYVGRLGEAITHRLSCNSRRSCSNEWSCRLSAESLTASASCRSQTILAFRCTWPAQPQNSRASVARSATLPAQKSSLQAGPEQGHPKLHDLPRGRLRSALAHRPRYGFNIPPAISASSSAPSASRYTINGIVVRVRNSRSRKPIDQ